MVGTLLPRVEGQDGLMVRGPALGSVLLLEACVPWTDYLNSAVAPSLVKSRNRCED